ncbi:MAG: helix-turn-helix transcriptional regulator [Bacteroidetes bacterium]|nr:helix-turn-helix transcriptional regulator [Bacteroidota bacterium]
MSHSPFDLILAINLNNLRREANLLQKEAALGIEVSPQIYGQLEKGTYHFSDEIIDAICLFFKIEKSEFVKMNDKVNLGSNASTLPNQSHIINADDVVKGLMEEVKKLREELIEELKSAREERKVFMEFIKNMQVKTGTRNEI